MAWFSDNLIETLLIIGVALLIIEVVVLGFSTFFLFFAGLGALTTSLLIWLGVIPEDYLYSIIAIAVSTGIYALILWKPLSTIQNKVDKTRPKSDLIGYQFVLPEKIVATSPLSEKPLYQYSGIDWRLQSKQDINKGELVEVRQVDVGTLWVTVANTK